jgi:hypothetical protein
MLYLSQSVGGIVLRAYTSISVSFTHFNIDNGGAESFPILRKFKGIDN